MDEKIRKLIHYLEAKKERSEEMMSEGKDLEFWIATNLTCNSIIKYIKRELKL